MSAMFVTFTPRLGFGKLDLLRPDGGVDLEIPVDLIDRPEVLKALLALADAGGSNSSKFERADMNGLDVVVDRTSNTITFEEPNW